MNTLKVKAKESGMLKDLDEELKEWIKSVQERMIKRWLILYPQEFILENIEQAFVWTMDTKKKHKSLSLFLNSWLKRAHKDIEEVTVKKDIEEFYS